MKVKTKSTSVRILAAILLLFCIAPGTAGGAQPPSPAVPPSLGLPLLCRIGSTCWLVNLVDHGPGRSLRDYACGEHTYNGKTGTDFAIRDFAAMDDGVPVVAAAAGRVKEVRDGILDGDAALVGHPAVAARPCGNFVVLDHGDGWQTVYCSMRRNSLVVHPGQQVAKGDKLGLVGSSGLSDFPHVHFAVHYKGKTVDPFAGLDRKAQCGLALRPLWDREALSEMRRPMTDIYDGGFAPNEVNPVALRRGFYRNAALSARAPYMVFWIDMFWVQAGDKLSMKITAPDGRSVEERTFQMTKTEARHWQMLGKRKIIDWHPGTYRGVAVLERTGKDGKLEKFRLERSVTVK